MLPRDLKVSSFAHYPPEARRLASDHLEGLRRLPLSFAPSLLRELIDYDYRFPVERLTVEKQLGRLTALTDAQVSDWFGKFAAISLSRDLEDLDWVNAPSQFVEKETAYLWSTHQLDAFRSAAKEYGDRLDKIDKAEPLPMQRLGIAVIGRGVSTWNAPIMRNLRKQGTYFSNLQAGGGLAALLSSVEKRAERSPVSYAHWYVDGGTPSAHSSRITCVSYDALSPVRNALLKRMQSEIERPGMGPEELRTMLAGLSPTDLNMEKVSDPVLSRFELKLFTEGSGTQIYSTTFAQWTAREALRRAQPLTLLVRYAPRQRQRPMNELLSGSHAEVDLDPAGSLVDAEMGAYYHWIDQQRLPEADRSAFIAWFEDHGDAVAIGPSMPRGTESRSALSMEKLLSILLS